VGRGVDFVRRFALGAVIALAGLLATSAAPAMGSVTIGHTFVPDQFFGGSGTFIQTGSPGNDYAVPSDGVITSWSFQAGADPIPPMKLKMFRAAGGDDYTTVGESQLVTPAPDVLNTFPTQIPVNAGDVPGHFYTDSTFSFRELPGFTAEFNFGDPGTPGLDAPPGTTLTYEPDAGDQIDVSAALEPDADHDGFGDETQDACPANPATQGSCPAQHKKKCKKRKKHRSAEAAKKHKCKKKHH
jgi:hypothetical protein